MRRLMLLLGLPVLAGVAWAFWPTPVATIHASDVSVHRLTRDFSNVYVLAGPAGAVLVDAGLPGGGPQMVQDLATFGIAPADVRAVVVTHAHADHAGTAAFWQRQGAQIIVGAGDQEMLASGRVGALCPVGRIAQSRVEKDARLTFEGLEADVIVQDALDLSADFGIPATIVRVGSHTPGSVVVRFDDMVMVGDNLRGAITFSAARRHFYICDLAENDAAIARIMDEIAPDAQTVMTGHFGPVSRASVERFLAKQP